MGVYAVTGSASGMGRQVAAKLTAAGHSVIGVDIRDADVVADLSTAQGRRNAAAGVLTACGGRLDGAILAAGLGPEPGTDRPRLILQVNYFGVVDLLRIWQPALAAGRAKVVVVGSNATTTTPLVPARTVRALIKDEPDKALATLKHYGPLAPPMAYGASKTAVSRWVRANAVTSEWAGVGVRLNVIAPGAVLTPLLERQLATPSEARAIKAFPVPVGGFGDAGELADWMIFMLSDAADFLCGSVIFVDGGSDAYFNAALWPRGVSARRLANYLIRMRSFRAPNTGLGRS